MEESQKSFKFAFSYSERSNSISEPFTRVNLIGCLNTRAKLARNDRTAMKTLEHGKSLKPSGAFALGGKN